MQLTITNCTYINNGSLASSALGCKEVVVVLLTVRLAIMLLKVVRRERFHADRTLEALWVPGMTHGHYLTALQIKTKFINKITKN